MKTYKIHLIRHGLTQNNYDGTYLGQTDVPVCEEGLEQLRQMKAQMTYPEVGAVFSSPLIRCKQTADILYPDQNPIIINEFKEYDFGEWEGKTADDLKDDELFKAWLSGGPDECPPFGESNAAFGKRIAEAFQKVVEGLFKTGVTDAAIITHGGVIMSIMSMFALPEASMAEWLTPNGCGYTIRVTPSLWTKIYKAEAIEEIPYYEPTEEEEAMFLESNPDLDSFGNQLSGFGFIDLEDQDD